MNSCELLDRFFDEDLSSSEKELFAAHLPECKSCSIAVENWSIFTQTVGELEAQERQHLAASNRQNRADIEAELKNREHTSVHAKYWQWAVAATILLGLGIGTWSLVQQQHKEITPEVAQYVPVTGIEVSKDGRTTKTWRPGEKIVSSKDNRVFLKVDEATIGLKENAAMKLFSTGKGDTQIRLQRGCVAANVEKRKQGDKFVVAAGPYAVQIVGTAFSVEVNEDGIIVSVAHGTVDILKDNRRISRVQTGERVSIFDSGDPHLTTLDENQLSELKTLLSEKQSAPLAQAPASTNDQEASKGNDEPGKVLLKVSTTDVDYAQWESWIVQGRYDNTRNALQRRLRQAPRDTRAWSLLGDCEKRAKNWEASVRAYKQVIAKGNKATARTARFKAGVVYQEKLGKHAAAEKMFRRFVSDSTSKTLVAQGMLRQAKSLRALGKTEQANGLLSKITSRYADTTAAVEANKMRNQ